MFLKNVPPVVALQTEWRPYGPIRTFSLPICFTDSESELSTTGTPIPDKVHMIIESLRSTQSSIDMNNDYNDSMQGNHVRAKCSGGPTGRETQEVSEKKAMEDAKPALLSNSDTAESLDQDSDSDDSVDRDIEEAIQEYLKKKNDYRAQSMQNNAPCDKMVNRNSVVIRDRAPKKIESAVLPVNAAKKKEEPRDRLRLNASKRPRCSSSSSASSDDSFDQSIQEEIKRFLTEKKEHAGETHISKKPKSTPPPVKNEKPSAEVSLHFKKNAINRTFVSSNTAATQTTRGPSDNFQVFCKVEDNLSDSSSDDGIEEAIQRYQLEKQKEGDLFKFSGSTQTQPSLDLCAAPIVKHQKILSRKKKRSGSKPAASTHNISKDLDMEEARGNVFPSPEMIRFEPTLPLKGNTSAELMCAEAILDISKAVLPATIQPSIIVTKACTNTSPLPSGDVPYCLENSDSSSVDSDDGIEQEIRNFLALKAQMNSQPASTGSLVHKQENICALQQKKLPPSQKKKLSLSLSRKRKLKEVESVAREGVAQENHIKEQRQVEPVAASDGSSGATLQTTSTSAELNEAPDMPNREVDVDHQYNSVKPMEINSSGTPGKLGKESMQFEDTEREQTGDKSSSLDSDEDLDSAIKELLKTKRKVKKKTKDSKAKCKKRVSFGGVEMYPVDSLETVKHKSVTELPPGANQSSPKSYISKSSSRNLNQKLRRSNLKNEKKSKASDQSKHVPGSKGQSTLDNSVTGKDHKVTGPMERIVEDTSSVDSDDSIELEIRKFLAEKAKASAMASKHKEEQKETCSRISSEARELKLEPEHAQQIGISASVGLHSGQSNQVQPGSESDQISATDSQEFIVRSAEKKPQVTVALGKNATVSHWVKNVDEALQRHSFEKKSSPKSTRDSLRSTSAEQRGLADSSLTTAENNIADLKDVDLNSNSQACQETLASVGEETFQIRAVISSDVEGGQQQKTSSDSSLGSCNHHGKVRQSDKFRHHVPADDDVGARSLKSGCEKGEEVENREREFSSADVKSVYSKHSSVGHMSPEKRQTRETDSVSLQSSVVENTESNVMKQPVNAVQFTRPRQGRAEDSEDHLSDKGLYSSESKKKARECNTEEQEAGDVGLDETCLESDDDQSEIVARERLKGNGKQSTL
ncbi:protein phosphatase 1 regulatory subunit 26 [Polyodon spathula]|uniref:protein phosphatase 1 regulatory subunit 26 n=1 Tax=Polyodon spathula TaxID=7913 RepID=UPI001B7F2885|nr:protein phosphatase 1 regulatory subunit 26 [Polyodon spathula]